MELLIQIISALIKLLLLFIFIVSNSFGANLDTRVENFKVYRKINSEDFKDFQMQKKHIGVHGPVKIHKNKIYSEGRIVKLYVSSIFTPEISKSELLAIMTKLNDENILIRDISYQLLVSYSSSHLGLFDILEENKYNFLDIEEANLSSFKIISKYLSIEH
jgi:hypothetical protein